MVLKPAIGSGAMVSGKVANEYSETRLPIHFTPE